MNLEGRSVYNVTLICVRWLPLSGIENLADLVWVMVEHLREDFLGIEKIPSDKNKYSNMEQVRKIKHNNISMLYKIRLQSI